MTQPQLLLDQALQVLDRVGPLTTGALARQLTLSDRASYIMMVSAESNRLVYANTAGQWAITERGRQTLEASQRRADRAEAARTRPPYGDDPAPPCESS